MRSRKAQLRAGAFAVALLCTLTACRSFSGGADSDSAGLNAAGLNSAGLDDACLHVAQLAVKQLRSHTGVQYAVAEYEKKPIAGTFAGVVSGVGAIQCHLAVATPSERAGDSIDVSIGGGGPFTDPLAQEAQQCSPGTKGTTSDGLRYRDCSSGSHVMPTDWSEAQAVLLDTATPPRWAAYTHVSDAAPDREQVTGGIDARALTLDWLDGVHFTGTLPTGSPTGPTSAADQGGSVATVPSEAPATTTSSSAQPVDRGYRSYTNPRFGFTCDVPVDFRPGEDPANGDGLAFSSADGAAQVICSGSNNALQESPQEAFADALKAAADAGSTVTYRRLNGDAFTVSGTGSDGGIFYEHTVWGSASSVTVFWSYPSSMKEQLDGAVQRSVQTLRPGDLSTGH